MVTPELLEFVRAQQKGATSKKELEQLLLSEGGWTAYDIADAFRRVGWSDAPSSSPPPMRQTEPQQKEEPRASEKLGGVETVGRRAPDILKTPATVSGEPVLSAKATNDTPRENTNDSIAEVVFEATPDDQSQSRVIKEMRAILPEEPFDISVPPEEDFLGIFSGFMSTSSLTPTFTPTLATDVETHGGADEKIAPPPMERTFENSTPPPPQIERAEPIAPTPVIQKPPVTLEAPVVEKPIFIPPPAPPIQRVETITPTPAIQKPPVIVEAPVVEKPLVTPPPTPPIQRAEPIAPTPVIQKPPVMVEAPVVEKPAVTLPPAPPVQRAEPIAPTPVIQKPTVTLEAPVAMKPEVVSPQVVTQIPPVVILPLATQKPPVVLPTLTPPPTVLPPSPRRPISEGVTDGTKVSDAHPVSAAADSKSPTVTNQDQKTTLSPTPPPLVVANPSFFAEEKKQTPPASTSPIKFDFVKARNSLAVTLQSEAPSQGEHSVATDEMLKEYEPSDEAPQRLEDIMNAVTNLTRGKGVTPMMSPRDIKPLPSHRTMSSDLLLHDTVAPTIADGSQGGVAAGAAPTSGDAEGATSGKAETAATTPLPQTIPATHDRSIARVFLIVLALLSLIALISFGAYMVMRARPPAIVTNTLHASIARFFGTTAFAYKGSGDINLVIAPTKDGAPRTATTTFSLTAQGGLKNSKDGLGNGNHELSLNGNFTSGDLTWPAQLSSDVRLIDSTLYFHLHELPTTSNLDPDIAKNYWITIDIADIASALHLTIPISDKSVYGNFGGGGETFGALLIKNDPFIVQSERDETRAGVPVTVYRLTPESTRALTFVTDLYRAYTKNTLVLDDQKRAELVRALSKVVIDVSVNQKSGEIMESTIEANFDDDILDEHVKGTVHVTLSFSDFNTPVTVDMPTSIVTLSELKTEMDNYQKVKDVRVRDHARVATLERLIAHIDAYHIAKGRYPVALRDLLQGHATSTQDISEADLSQVFYASYITSMPLSKLNRCTQNSAQCALYTIGINLDDVTNPLLREDRDIDSDVHGNDNAGCAGEKNVACYDLSSTPKDAAAQSVHVGFSDTPSPVGTSTANATNSAPTIATPPSMGSTTVGR